MKDLNISVIDSFEQWKAIASEWNDLLDISASGTVFLTWEWLAAWAERCINDSRRLFILTLKDKESLIGIAPFYIEETHI